MSDNETQFLLRLPTDVYQQYILFAQEDKRSRNYVMCVALAEYAMKRQEKAQRRAARLARREKVVNEAA